MGNENDFEFWSQSKNFRKDFYNVQIRNQRLDFFFFYIYKIFGAELIRDWIGVVGMGPFMPTLSWISRKKKKKHGAISRGLCCNSVVPFLGSQQTLGPQRLQEVEAILYPLFLFQHISLAWLKNSTSITHKEKQKR